MGKATIVSEQGAGLYTVRVDAGEAVRQAEEARLSALVAELQQRVDSWSQTLAAFEQQEEAPARAVVDAAQNAYIAAVRSPTPPSSAEVRALIGQHSAALKALLETQARAGLLRAQLATWQADLAQARKDLVRVQAIVAEQEVSAWCADYTEDAAGDVATIEIPGEWDSGGALLVIAPAAPVPGPEHGRLLARELQQPHQVFFNAAVLPGWQRWKPTHRLATVTALDLEADTAAVSFDAAQSSAQGLAINQVSSMQAVPVRYMDCNAAAFEVGDRVVVEFGGQSWDSPAVIGFESNPRPCDLVYVGGSYRRYNPDYSADLFAVVALVSPSKLEVQERWIYPFEAGSYATHVLSIDSVPYHNWEFFASGGNTTPQDFHRRRLSTPVTPGADEVWLSTWSTRPVQHRGRYYAILSSGPETNPDAGRYWIEFDGSGAELRRVEIDAPTPGGYAFYGVAAADDHLAVAGFNGVADQYQVRVYSIGTGALLHVISTGYTVIEDVHMSPQHMAVITWSGIEVYARPGYALARTIATPYPAASIVVASRRTLVTMDYAQLSNGIGRLKVYDIDGTLRGELDPFAGVPALLGGGVGPPVNGGEGEPNQSGMMPVASVCKVQVERGTLAG